LVDTATGGSGSGIASPAGAAGNFTSPLAMATAWPVAMPSGVTSFACCGGAGTAATRGMAEAGT
jgi:hypothetical protein